MAIVTIQGIASFLTSISHIPVHLIHQKVLIQYNFCGRHSPTDCKSFSLGSLLDYKKGALCNSVADILCSTAHLDAHTADIDRYIDAQDSLIQQQVKHVCINKL